MSLNEYLVSWTAFSDDNIACETANCHTVRIHQSTIMLSDTSDSKQEVTLSVKHLQSTADLYLTLAEQIYCIRFQQLHVIIMTDRN